MDTDTVRLYATSKTRVQNLCSTCRLELGNIRCLALEKVAESLELPCKCDCQACPEVLSYYSKLKHETLCKYESQCSVVGDIPFVDTRLRGDHKVDNRHAL